MVVDLLMRRRGGAVSLCDEEILCNNDLYSP